MIWGCAFLGGFSTCTHFKEDLRLGITYVGIFGQREVEGSSKSKGGFPEGGQKGFLGKVWYLLCSVFWPGVYDRLSPDFPPKTQNQNSDFWPKTPIVERRVFLEIPNSPKNTRLSTMTN